MKITIDTKEDSHEEIKKIIKMLSSLVGEQEIISNQGNIFSGNSENNENSQNDMFSVFGSNSGNGSETKTESNDDKNKKDETEIDIPDMEEYL